jgi:hypothetical protein
VRECTASANTAADPVINPTVILLAVISAFALPSISRTFLTCIVFTFVNRNLHFSQDDDISLLLKLIDQGQ